MPTNGTRSFYGMMDTQQKNFNDYAVVDYHNND